MNTALIRLTRGLFAKIDSADFVWLNQWKWHAVRTKQGRLYAARTINGGEKVYMHRVILGGLGILDGEHADGDGLNNQRFNLRPATRSQNQANRRKFGAAIYRGVYPNRKLFRTRVSLVSGGLFHVGSFVCPKEAALAYDAAARLIWGPFARLNFPKVETVLPSEVLAKLKLKLQ